MNEPEFDADDPDAESMFDFLDEGSTARPRSPAMHESGRAPVMPIIRKPVPVSESGALRAPAIDTDVPADIDEDFAFLADAPTAPGRRTPDPDVDAGPIDFDVTDFDVADFRADPSPGDGGVVRSTLFLLAIALLGGGALMVGFPYLPFGGETARVADADAPPVATGEDVAGPGSASRSLGARFRAEVARIEALLSDGRLDEAESAIAGLDRAVYGYGITEFGDLEARIAAARVGGVPDDATSEPAGSTDAAVLAESVRREADLALEAERLAEAERAAEAERREAERLAEAERAAEAERREIERSAEVERREAERLAEAERAAETARLEAERVAEAERLAEEARAAEARRTSDDQARRERLAAARAAQDAEAARARAAARNAARARAEALPGARAGAPAAPVAPRPGDADPSAGAPGTNVPPIDREAIRRADERATTAAADRRATDRRIAEQLAARERNEAPAASSGDTTSRAAPAPVPAVAAVLPRAAPAPNAGTTARAIDDADLELVYQRLLRVRDAFENRDIEAIITLSDPPSGRVQQLLQIFANSESVSTRIANVSTSAVDSAITGTLRIESIRRADGSRVAPPAGLESVALTSTREGGDWSALSW